jgi:serine/alanine adding enzyme
MLSFYNLDTINNTNIDYPDIYFTPEYGKACEYSDNAIWELCKFKDLIYVYLKKPIEVDNKTYYDLITPYGYSGYYFRLQETYNKFIGLFRQEAKKRGYITEVLRQNPYLDIKIENYEVISSKTLFAANSITYEDYINSIKKSTRKNINKINKSNYNYNFIKLNEGDLKKYNFCELYNLTMERNNSKQYYYFNQNYFDCLEKNDYTYLSILNLDDKIVGFQLIFKYKNFIHVHLSCDDRSSNLIKLALINGLVKHNVNDKNIFIFGCGIKDGDTLAYFKSGYSNKNYKYVIYKNNINTEVK